MMVAMLVVYGMHTVLCSIYIFFTKCTYLANIFESMNWYTAVGAQACWRSGKGCTHR
jgi:hypothetical protein